jgi:tRNA G18 (ribose-2'-O)-methylase SpoU
VTVAASEENCKVLAIMNIIKIEDPSDPRLDPYRNIRERDLVSRDKCFIAEGKVVLTVLLSSPAFQARSVLVLESRLAGIMPVLETAERNFPVYVVEAKVMDGIAGFAVHRGILALGERRLPVSPQLAFSDDALVVVIAGLSNHDNVGAVFRNAAAFQAEAVLLDDESCDPLYRKALRVSVGAVLKVPFSKGGTLYQIADNLAADGFKIAALSPSGTNRIVDFPQSGRRALILGSEGHGLPPALLARLSAWTIPMAEDFDSLNVATASGIALFYASGFSGPHR